MCHRKLGGVNPTDIPVLGKAKLATAVGAADDDDDSSDESDDSDDDASPAGGGPARPAGPRQAGGGAGSSTEQEQRVEVMRLVKASLLRHAAPRCLSVGDGTRLVYGYRFFLDFQIATSHSTVLSR